jgi:hypothetical protein
MLKISLALMLALLATLRVDAEEAPNATMYKQAYCSCCDGHADHLRANGFNVTVLEMQNMSEIKAKHGVPPEFEGCHTIEVGGYVVEGHVTAKIIRKLLKERPAIRGISLPGMPDGSPGMSGAKREPFVIYELGSTDGRVFARD